MLPRKMEVLIEIGNGFEKIPLIGRCYRYPFSASGICHDKINS